MRRSVLLITTLLSIFGERSSATQAVFDKPPKRPRLPVDADTNNAVAYYSYGVATLPSDAEKAAAAFYWASRLDPGWAAPLYGEHASLLLAQPPSDLTGYLTRRKEALRDQDLLRIDSLAYLALLKNPFVDRRFDGVVLSTWFARETDNQSTLRDLGMYDRRFTAWAAYTRGDYKMANSVFAEVIRRQPDDPTLRVWRALALFALGQNDSARVAVQDALGLERTTEEALPGVGWVSHAFAEYSVGFLFALNHQPDSARAAYERALLDDVAFHPAHHQLGRTRLAMHDTTGALAEYAQATSLAPNDAIYLYDLGMLLIVMGQPDSGTTVLRRAISAEPFFALPHFTLGLIYEQSGFHHEAAEHYAAFLQLAPRTMGPAIASAREHLVAVQGRP